MQRRRMALAAAAAVALLCLLVGWADVGPIFLVRPTVTRRPQPYQVAYPKNSGCGYALNLGEWTSALLTVGGNCTAQEEYALCGAIATRRWEWHAAARACGARHMDLAAVQSALAGKWVACVGDSIARNLCAALLRALAAPAAAFAFDRHADFERALDPGVRLTFHWSPFPENTTALFASWRRAKKPDLIITTTALWHVLHIRDVERYELEMRTLAGAAQAMLPKRGGRAAKPPLLLVASATEVHPERMTTPEKRAAMTPARVDAYNAALVASGALVGGGGQGGPFGLLDLFKLTHGCGLECSVDGVHSQPFVYDSAAQVLLNIVRRCERDNESCWVT